MSQKPKIKKTTVKLTYAEKMSVLNVINPVKNGPNGPYRSQSDLSQAKGKIGVAVYFLKDDIKRAFSPLDERVDDLRKQGRELIEEKQKLENPDGDKTKNADIEKRIAEIDKEISKINEDLEAISREEEEVTLRRDLLPNEATDYMGADEIEILERFIKF